jgi:hypothetical protein
MRGHRCTEVNTLGAQCVSTARSGDIRCPFHAALDLEMLDLRSGRSEGAVTDPV